MKKMILFLIGALPIFFGACQSDSNESLSEDIAVKISDFEISALDAAKAFSHTPTGLVTVKTSDKSEVNIDFSCNKELLFQSSDKNYILLVDKRPVINCEDSESSAGYYELAKDYLLEAKADTINSLAQLITVYNSFSETSPNFTFGYSSSFTPWTDGDNIYSTIEYLLAQACFQDDCKSLTRKTVLKMAVEKQAYKFKEYQITYKAYETGLFLMATIMVKENYLPFIKAVLSNSELQDVLSLNFDETLVDKGISDIVSRYAAEYLAK
jgi:hypothetical protein